jgi:hypothetical protein
LSTWVHEKAATPHLIILHSGCAELLEEYNRKHKVVLAEDIAISAMGKNAPVLENLLNPLRLASELAQLQGMAHFCPSKRLVDGFNPSNALSSWIDQNQVNNVLCSYLKILPDNSTAACEAHFYRVLSAVKTLPEAVVGVTVMSIGQRMLQWGIARTLVLVYEWYDRTGVVTIKRLLDIYRTSGYNALQREAPTLVNIIDHVVRYIYEQQKLLQKNQRQKKKLKSSVSGKIRQSYREQEISEKLPAGPVRACLEDIPPNIYGLRSCHAATPAINLKSRIKNMMIPHKLTDGFDAVYATSCTVLENLLSDILFIPNLQSVDTFFNNKRRASGARINPKLVRDRAIARGAIIKTVTNAFGTDAIFSSEIAGELLSSPTLLFGDYSNSKEDRLVAHILHHDNGLLEQLDCCVKSLLKPTGNEAPLIARKMGDFVQNRTLELLKRASGSQTEARPLGGHDTSTQAVLDTNVTSCQLHNGQPTSSSESHQNVSFPSTMHSTPTLHQSSPDFLPLMLIIRENVSILRGCPPDHEILRRILTGHHATRSAERSKRNPDHTNPSRRHLVYAKLLNQHLPPQMLTTQHGLSNLLAWMGTGQGFRTERFLREFSPFYCTSSNEMVAKFADAIYRNKCTLGTLSHATNMSEKSKDTQASKDIPGYIVYEDQTIWGQPCNLISATPTRVDAQIQNNGSVTLTLEEKFAPYFAPEIQEKWLSWLGDLANQNPQTLDDHIGQKSWAEAYEFITSLQLEPFKNSLSTYQLANNLALADIVKHPTSTDVTAWMDKHKNLGACRGLKRLGFKPTDRGSIDGAFQCVQDHLEHYLVNTNNLDVQDHGAMDIEHLLCKVVRWEDRLKKEGICNGFNHFAGTIESTSSDWYSFLIIGMKMTRPPFKFLLQCNKQTRKHECFQQLLVGNFIFSIHLHRSMICRSNN